jgi:hypothetical protein
MHSTTGRDSTTGRVHGENSTTGRVRGDALCRGTLPQEHHGLLLHSRAATHPPWATGSSLTPRVPPPPPESSSSAAAGFGPCRFLLFLSLSCCQRGPPTRRCRPTPAGPVHIRPEARNHVRHGRHGRQPSRKGGRPMRPDRPSNQTRCFSRPGPAGAWSPGRTGPAGAGQARAGTGPGPAAALGPAAPGPEALSRAVKGVSGSGPEAPALG